MAYPFGPRQAGSYPFGAAGAWPWSDLPFSLGAGGGVVVPPGWVATSKVIATGDSIPGRSHRANSASSLLAGANGMLNWLYALSGGRFDFYLRREATADSNYQRGLSGFSFCADSSAIDTVQNGAPVTNFTGGTWSNPGCFDRMTAMRASPADVLILQPGGVEQAGALTAAAIRDKINRFLDNGSDTGFLTGRSNKAVILCSLAPRGTIGSGSLSTAWASDDSRRAVSESYRDMLREITASNPNVFLADFWEVLRDATLPGSPGKTTTGGYSGWSTLIDGTHLSNDGAFLCALELLRILNVLCGPAPALNIEPYNASTNPFGTLSGFTKMLGTGGAKTAAAEVVGDVTTGLAFRRTVGTAATLFTLSKRPHPTIPGCEQQGIRIQCDGSGSAVSTWSFPRESNMTVLPVVDSEVQAYLDIEYERGSRSQQNGELVFDTRAVSTTQQASTFLGSLTSGSIPSEYQSQFPSGLGYYPDLTGRKLRLTSYALPFPSAVTGSRTAFNGAHDESKVCDMQLWLGPWAINPRAGY